MVGPWLSDLIGGIGISASPSCFITCCLTGEQFLQACPLWRASSSGAQREEQTFNQLHGDAPFEEVQGWENAVFGHLP